MHRHQGSTSTGQWLLLGFLLAQVGCAAAPVVTRTDRLHDLAGRYVYDLPLEQVWPHASGMMRDEGHPVRETGDAFQLVTDWKETVGGGIGKVWVQYMVWGERIDSDRCIIRIIRSQVVLVPSELRSTTSRHNGTGMEQVNPLKVSTPLALPLKFKKAEDRATAGTTQTAGRDLGMEWALLQRVAPLIARQLEAYAAR